MTKFFMNVVDGRPDQVLRLDEIEGAYPVRLSDRPDETINSIVEGDHYMLDDGVVCQKWVVRERTPAEVEAIKQLPRWEELPMVVEAAALHRAERNAKLASSDWTQVADAPIDKAVWATYRQGLRDITSQAGFPFDVQWPQEPNWPTKTR